MKAITTVPKTPMFMERHVKVEDVEVACILHGIFLPGRRLSALWR
jgi:hypothetical protein